MSQPEKLELYQEYPQPGEEEVAKKLAEYLKWVILNRDYLTGTTNRDVHGKGFPALKAEFIIEPNLPAELRHGVFKEGGRRYPAWIRLSNSSQKPGPDIKKDVRGFAIKLMGVPGEKLLWEDRDATTQDFLLFSSEVFFTRDTADFFGLMKAANTNIFAALWFILTHPSVGLVLLRGNRRFANLLEVDYFSTTPYRLGEVAVRYALQPAVPAKSAIPKTPGNNFLRDALHAQLARTEVSYNFFVQVQKDPYRQPIEDGQATWSTELSPYQKVATVRIPVQAVDTAERRQTSENLSMNIWHSLPEHRPLGNLNRARGLVYREIAQFRHERNLAPLVEPTAGPDFLAP